MLFSKRPVFLSFHLVFSLSLPLTLLIVPSSLSKEWTWPGAGEGEVAQKETSTGLSQIDLMDEETGLGDSAWPRLTSHWWLVQFRAQVLPDPKSSHWWLVQFRAQVLPDPTSSEKFLIPILQNRAETANFTGHLALLQVQPES